MSFVSLLYSLIFTENYDANVKCVTQLFSLPLAQFFIKGIHTAVCGNVSLNYKEIVITKKKGICSGIYWNVNFSQYEYVSGGESSLKPLIMLHTLVLGAEYVLGVACARCTTLKLME